MQRKLFLTYIFIIVMTLFGALLAFWGRGYQVMRNQVKETVESKALVVSAELSLLNRFEEEIQNFVDISGEKYSSRITVIEHSGHVIADSHEAAVDMDNHSNREEVKLALDEGIGRATRYSRTTGIDYYYVAYPFSNGTIDGIVRLSVPLSSYQVLGFNMLDSILVLLGIGIIVSLLFAIFFTQRMMSPIIEMTDAAERILAGDYDHRILTKDEGHIGRLAKAFNKMSKNLRITMDIMTSRKTELEAILSSMTSGVIAIDRKSNIMFFNQSFQRIFECEGEDIENEPLFQVIRNVAINDVIEDVRESEEKVVKEGALSISDDKIIKVIGAPLKKEEEKVIGILLVIDDITEIKKLQTIRQEFVSNVTHELKTPLTSIRGFVDTLKNGAVNDPKFAIRFLDIIDIEAERLYTLIQDILVLSEIESKKDEEKQHVCVKELLDDVILMLEGKQKEEVEIVAKVDSNVQNFFCNPFRLKEIFINLIDNAVKYTEKGQVEVLCTQSGSNLCIQIKDTGIGIDEEHLPRLFERFYRVDKGRSRKQGGTGLGLSIVKHIVELYDGDISVESTLGKGTTFQIKLPYSGKSSEEQE